jgi:AraC-like DNA-binding protein
MEALRVREAKTLLAAGEQVKAIAAKLGYMHVSSFSRAFKRAHGVAPRRFRHFSNAVESSDVPYG